jgi:hypothetical protein
MKVQGLYDTKVKLERKDLVALVDGRLWIRFGSDLYVSTTCSKIDAKNIPDQLNVHSAGEYSDARRNRDFPRKVAWVHYRPSITLRSYES